MRQEGYTEKAKKRAEATIGGEKIFTKANLALLSLTYSFVFQVGYFTSLEIGLITYLNIGQIVINTSVLVPIFVLVIFVAFSGWEFLLNHLEQQKPQKEFIAYRSSQVALSLILILLVAIYLWLFYQDFKDEPLNYVITLCSLPIMYSGLLWMLGVVQTKLDGYGSVRRIYLIAGTFLFILTSYSTGLSYSHFLAGQTCDVTMENEVVSFKYFLSVDGAIIGTFENDPIVLNKSEVTKMVCPREIKT